MTSNGPHRYVQSFACANLPLDDADVGAVAELRLRHHEGAKARVGGDKDDDHDDVVDGVGPVRVLRL